jgi:hypothetical protein
MVEIREKEFNQAALIGKDAICVPGESLKSVAVLRKEWAVC